MNKLQELSQKEINEKHYLTKREEKFFDKNLNFFIGLNEIDQYNSTIDKWLINTKDTFIGYFPGFELNFSCVQPFANKVADQRNFGIVLFHEGTNVNVASKSRLTSSLIGKSWFQETMSFRLPHEIAKFLNIFNLEINSKDFELMNDSLGLFTHLVKSDSEEYEFFTEIANFYGHKK
jgi:hypothetical protein